MENINLNTKTKIFSYILFGALLVVLFLNHLFLSVLTGMVTYVLINKTYGLVNQKIHPKWSSKITAGILVILISMMLLGLYFGLYYAIKSTNNNSQQLVMYVMTILEEIKNYLPEALVKYIPVDVFSLKEKVSHFLGDKSSEIFTMTTSSLKTFLHALIGIVLGSVVAFSFVNETRLKFKPLSEELKNRISIFTDVFEKVLMAQWKISLINTALTAVYILIILPMFDINLSHAKTVILATFIFGFIPVLGNLLSNSAIILLSLAISFNVAISSMVFLVVIHKLEYYVNAKIVGNKLNVSIWELLLSMILMETFFGIIGVVAAPIIYGYIKQELINLELI